jgi:hypothetical protein
MRVESLELLAREYGTTVAKISKWRDEFLNAGEVKNIFCYLAICLFNAIITSCLVQGVLQNGDFFHAC